ncbi:YqaA family protein [Rhizobium sp. BK376]|uniref:YqaA family protein n=1 Tax=Rhizobium sp. BK376 TaxID=2512149 RepID=UPI001050B9F3|nr:YqaA family protein [Rhizobium sp. BK376]TCR85264.1 membrane protein YqaA with SNARE-associated domain [Rhizobium sp. BK376]
MMGRLRDWTISLASSRSAEVWLAVTAFVESSVFLVPADVLFIPMVLARPSRQYRLAAIATIASVAGGIAGWLLGYYAYEAVANPILAFYGKDAAFEHMRSYVDAKWIAILLVTSGLFHAPPIKVVTILAGVVKMNLLLFVVLATAARGARFYLLGFLLARYGEAALDLFKRRTMLVTLVAMSVTVVIAITYEMMRRP